MTKELLEQLYLKLKNEPENDRKNKTGCFDFFEEKVLSEQRYNKYKNVSVTSKTMKNYYEKHVEGRNNKSNEPCSDLKNLIAEYLGYKSYLDFCYQMEQKSRTNTPLIENSKKKIINMAFCLYYLFGCLFLSSF